MILSYFNSTLFSEKMTSSLGKTTLAYLEDYTHLIFGITISIAGTLCIYILYRIPESIDKLVNEGVLKASHEEIQKHYMMNRKIANSIFPKIISFIAMALTGIMFFRFYYSSQYDYWWGNMYNGYTTIYFVFVEMLMVYYGTQVIFLFIVYSKFLYNILFFGISPKLFHYDNSNGLSALGNMIVLKWFVAIFIILCVFIVLFYGYLGLENSFLTKLLIGIFSLTIPIIAVLPLNRSLSEISKAKEEKLKVFGSILNDDLNKIETYAAHEDMDKAKANVNNFLEVQQIYLTISKMNVFPFNPRALASVVIIYAFQVGVTIYKLITG
jgi:hypothetical protein